MISSDFANKFSNDWIAAWNSHDIETILSHYTDDFTLESPIAAQAVPDSGGILKGKAAVGKYWSERLQVMTNLFFEVHEVLTGISGLTIYYINKGSGRKAAEVFFFNEDGKVAKSFVYYAELR
jgi:ketosteroid isomerase-like protein